MCKIIIRVLILATTLFFAQGLFATALPLSFHANTLQPSPGQLVQYSLVAQTPHGRPENCQVTFNVPTGMTYERNSGTGGGGGGSGQSLNCSSSQCTWSLRHVHNVNGHVEIYLRVNNGVSGTIASPTISGSGCGFPASVPYVDPGAGHQVPNGGALQVAQPPAPELTIQKTTTTATHVLNGNQVDYAIEVHNRGNTTANNVVVTDTIPTNTLYISHAGGTPNPVGNPAAGNPVTWGLGTLSPGQTRSVTMKLEVVAGSGVIDNTGEATCDNCAAPQHPVSASAPQIIIDAVPALTISKATANVHVNAGDTVSYTIDYLNTGSAAATGVVITDTLPVGLTYDSSTPSATSTSGPITWNLSGPLSPNAPGQIVVKATVDPLAAVGDLFTNRAAIDSVETVLLESNEVAVDVVGGIPVLLFDKTVDRASATAGDELTYTLSYENLGKAKATGLTLTDTLPTGVNFISASGSGSESGGVVSWTLPDILPGQTASEFIKVEVDPGVTSGPLTNQASLASTNAFQSLLTARANTNVRAAPVLTLSKAVDKPHAEAGKTVRYTITYENIGTVTATGVTITDDVDGLLQLPTSIPNAAIVGRKVTWSLGDLTPHASGSVSFDATVVAGAMTGDPIDNQALIEAVNANSATANVGFTVENKPKLILDKSTASQSVRPGEEILYTIRYANIGTASANTVVIEDTLPNNAALVATPSGAVLQGNNLVWNIASVPPGPTTIYTLSVRVRVENSASDGDRVENYTSITSTELPNAQTDFTSTPVVAAVLTVGKTASIAKASPGDTVDYTITVVNNGHTTADSLVIEDQLPAFMTLTSASGSYTESNGIIDWTIGTLAAGASTSVTAKVQLAGSVPDGSVLNNTVQASSTLASATDPNTPVKITSSPDLTLSKSVTPAQAKPGENVTYTISYSNVGTDTADDVTLIDQFPADLDFVSATGGISPVGSLLSWNLGSISRGASGSLTVRAAVKAGIPDGTVIANSASIGEEPGATQLNPKVASATMTVDNKPRFVISKNLVSPSLVAGQEAIYHIAVDNQGTADATNVVIDDILPGELSFVSAGGQSQPNVAGQKVTWTFPSWSAGSSSTIEYRVQVASPIRNGLSVDNIATLTSNQIGPLSASANATVSSLPVLALSKTASSAEVEPGPSGSLGGTIIYTINYENTGSDTATGITLQDHLPSEVTFLTASNGGIESGGVVSWSGLPDFPVGSAARSVTVTVQANSADTLKDGTKLHNTATIDSNETAPQSAFVDVLASGAPQLLLSKTASTSVVNAGQEVTYTLNYENSGTADAGFVRIEDLLPPTNTMTYVSNTGGGSAINNLVTWDIGPVAAGQKGSVTVTARAADVISDGTPIINQANLTNYIDGTYTTIAQGPLVASTSGAINSQAALTVDKIANVAAVTAGDEVTYTISYSNPGHDTATGLTLDDQLPSNLTFKSATGSATHTNGLVNWQLPDLPARASGSVSLVATVASPISDGTSITNTATIKASQVLPVVSPGVTITISSSPILELEKTAAAAVVNAGGNVAYTINYRNVGTDQAFNVIVEDNLPPELSFVSASPTSSGPADTSGVLPSGGIVKWNIGTLAAGQSGSLSLIGSLPVVIADGTALFNSAGMSSTRTTATSVISRVDVASMPVLTLDKTTATTVAAPSNDITYTLRYENIGSDTATAVTLTDVLPVNTSFAFADHGGQEIDPNTLAPSPGSGVVGWPMPNIAANTSGTVSVTVTAGPIIANGSILTNAATLTSSQTGPLSSTSSIPVSSAPQLVLQEKTSQTTYVSSGNQVLYTLTYENLGNDVATNLTVTDTYPIGAIPIAIDSSGSFDPLNSQAVWHLSRLAPGQAITVQYTLQVPIGTVNGTSWSTSSSVVAQNAAPAAAGTTLVVGSQPSITLTKIGSNSVEAGQQASYLIEYFNAGNGAASAVTIQDLIPPGWTPVLPVPNGGTQVGGTVQWDLGTIQPLSGGSVSVVFDTPAGLADGFVETNTATILGSNVSPTSAFATTVERSHIELDVNIFGSPSPVAAGGRVTFNLLYENHGNSNASDVTVTATVPASTTYFPGSATNGGVLTGNTITWGPLPLSAVTGGQVSFQVDVAPVVANGTSLVSNATIAAPSSQPDSDSAAVVVASAPQLITSKRADVQEVSPGDLVIYTITVENIGTEDATNLTITDTLPASLELLAAEPNGTVDSGSNTATWTLADLPVGATPIAVTATARVIAANADIVNTATVSSSTGPNQQITNPQSNIISGSAAPEEVPALSDWQHALLAVVLALLALTFINRYGQLRREQK